MAKDNPTTPYYPTEYVIKPPGRFSLNLAELWLYRELFYFFTWRDIKVKYKQTVLGFLWAVLQPFLMMLIFVLFFSRALSVPTDDIPAPVFYYSGLLLWNIFSTGLANAGNSMVTNANIIKKIYFPRLIIPMSSILVALFDFLMALVVFAGIIAYYEWTDPDFAVQYGLLLAYVPLALFLTVLSTFGLGSFLAALNVKYRDFRYVIPFFVQFMLFVTPVIYPVSIFEEGWAQYLLAANPMTGAVNLARAAFLDVPVDWTLQGISLLSGFFFFFLGLFVFRKTEAYFADVA